MEKQFLWLIDESCRFSNMDSATLLDTLHRMNMILESIIYHDDTYSYEAFFLILEQNCAEIVIRCGEYKNKYKMRFL